MFRLKIVKNNIKSLFKLKTHHDALFIIYSLSAFSMFIKVNKIPSNKTSRSTFASNFKRLIRYDRQSTAKETKLQLRLCLGTPLKVQISTANVEERKILREFQFSRFYLFHVELSTNVTSLFARSVASIKNVKAFAETCRIFAVILH